MTPAENVTQPKLPRTHRARRTSRALLVLLVPLLAVLALTPSRVLQPRLNRLLRPLDLSYDWLLWAEGHANDVLHVLGALLLTALLQVAELRFPRRGWPATLAVLIAVVALEAVHAVIGRGFSLADITLGAGGIAAGAALAGLSPRVRS